MPPGATSNADVTVLGARRGDFADASLDTGSIAFVLDCHVWSNDKVRVTARNVSLSNVDLPAAALHVQVVKRRGGGEVRRRDKRPMGGRRHQPGQPAAGVTRVYGG